MIIPLLIFLTCVLVGFLFVVRWRIIKDFGGKSPFLKLIWIAIISTVIGVVACCIGSMSHIVPTGMRGLVTHDGVISPHVLVPGKYYISPFDSVYNYDITPNFWTARDGVGDDVTMGAISGVSKDGVAVKVEFTLVWGIDERNLANFKSHSPDKGSYSYTLFEPVRHASSYALSKFSVKGVPYVDHDALAEVMLFEIRKRVVASMRAQGYGSESERIVNIMSVEINSVSLK